MNLRNDWNTRPEKDIANQNLFTPNCSSTSYSRIKLNLQNDLDKRSDNDMNHQI